MGKSVGIVAVVLALSPAAALAQSAAAPASGPTMTPAEVEAKADSGIHVSYSTYKGPMRDTATTIYRRLDKLHKDCDAEVKGVLEKSGAIPADQLQVALGAIKDANDRCMKDGIAKDSLLKTVRAEADFKMGDDPAAGGGRGG